MKTPAFISVLFFFLMGSGSAQTDSTSGPAEYQSWITTYNSPRIKSGIIYEIRDSSISIMTSRPNYMGYPVKPEISTINSDLIDVIKLRKQGAVGTGILVGALSGLVVGGVIDLVYYSFWKNQGEKQTNDFGVALGDAIERSPEYFAAVACTIGIACIGTGIGIGAAVGSVKISIPIHGCREQFSRNKAMLMGYSINHPR